MTIERCDGVGARRPHREKSTGGREQISYNADKPARIAESDNRTGRQGAEADLDEKGNARVPRFHGAVATDIAAISSIG